MTDYSNPPHEGCEAELYERLPRIFRESVAPDALCPTAKMTHGREIVTVRELIDGCQDALADKATEAGTDSGKLTVWAAVNAVVRHIQSYHLWFRCNVSSTDIKDHYWDLHANAMSTGIGYEVLGKDTLVFPDSGDLVRSVIIPLVGLALTQSDGVMPRSKLLGSWTDVE